MPRYRVFYSLGGGEPALETQLYHGEDEDAAAKAYLAGDHSGPLEVTRDGEFIDPLELKQVAEDFEKWYQSAANLERLRTERADHLGRIDGRLIAWDTGYLVEPIPQMDSYLRQGFLTWLGLDIELFAHIDYEQMVKEAEEQELEGPIIIAYLNEYIERHDRAWPDFARDYRHGLPF